tara:strand:- start:4018 stop:4260 length:243 start_codon:yes stop_codon:yes gene_type:complete
MAKSKQASDLDRWTKGEWTTMSGKKSSETNEPYAPKAVIDKLRSTREGRKKYRAAKRVKKKATRQGKQHAPHGLHKGKNR